MADSVKAADRPVVTAPPHKEVGNCSAGMEWRVLKKDMKTARSTDTGKVLTQPISGKKAAKFAQVEGLKMSAASKVLSQTLTANGLKGDAYRSEIVKAFKKA